MLYQPQPPTFNRPLTPCGTDATLHVCTIISNPVRYASRYKLYDAFKAQNEGEHIKHWTVEIAYGNRPFVLTERDNCQHLQLRTKSEIWHKENALNLLFAHVLSESPDAQYFAWVDADVTFARPDWAYETLQQLQHYDVVQMFSHAQDVGPKYEPIGARQTGFLYAYCNGMPTQATDSKPAYYGYGYSNFGHPGYAWAARKSALDSVGGLLDTCVLGSADHHMALGLVGKVGKSIHSGLSPRFQQHIQRWGDLANQHLNQNVGYVDGLLIHHWHGRKADRQYRDRWKILVDNQYDPDRDLKRDAQGLYQLTNTNIKLRDDIRSYFRARNEDSIDLE